jgi:hypothetical protein
MRCQGWVWIRNQSFANMALRILDADPYNIDPYNDFISEFGRSASVDAECS